MYVYGICLAATVLHRFFLIWRRIRSRLYLSEPKKSIGAFFNFLGQFTSARRFKVSKPVRGWVTVQSDCF